MPAQAHVTKIWRSQKLFLSLFLLALALYFFFDGSFTYPRSNSRWLAYRDFESRGQLDLWPAYAKAHGWTAKPPEKFYDDSAIFQQFAFGGMGFALGLVTLSYWFFQRGRILRTDADAVYSPAGTRVPFEAITGLGKKRWESKGFATVRYQIAGRKGQFVLDDYKFEREPTHAILAEIESRLLNVEVKPSTSSTLSSPDEDVI